MTGPKINSTKHEIHSEVKRKKHFLVKSKLGPNYRALQTLLPDAYKKRLRATGCDYAQSPIGYQKCKRSVKDVKKIKIRH